MIGFTKDDWEEVLTFLVKSGAWIYYTLLGFIAKVCYNTYRGKRMTFRQQLASLGMGVFVGYITFKVGGMYFPDKLAVVVPVSTLCADRIVEALLTINWRTAMNNIISIFQKNQKPE